MTALDQNPVSQNTLLPNRFKFQLKRAPNVNFWVQSAIIPAISSQPQPDQANPFNRIPQPGDHMEWGSFVIDFQVDDEFANYFEISDWMRQLYFPSDFKQYAELTGPEKEFMGVGIRSELVLSILDGQQSPKFEAVFSGAFPVMLSQLDFTVNVSELDRIMATATFEYESYTIRKLNPSPPISTSRIGSGSAVGISVCMAEGSSSSGGSSNSGLIFSAPPNSGLVTAL